MNTTTITSRELAAQFRFKAEEVIDESQIMTEHLEHRTSGFIAGRLINALEKKGYLVQSLVDTPKYTASEYHFSMPKGKFDIKLIALMSVQLSGLIIHIDQPMDMETIANTTFAYKRFNDIALANVEHIEGCYGGKTKEFWVSKVMKALSLAVDADLLTLDDDGKVVRSKRYISSCISRKGIAHQTNKITLDNRRKERVKTRFNPKKDGTSGRVRSAMEYIESQGQVVNKDLLGHINDYINQCAEYQIKLPDDIKDSMHVVKGCNELAACDVLYSEYFQDLRGRMYQFAHAGPNPQSSDLARALCYHDEKNIVYKNDVEHYSLFINELRDEVADCPYAMLPQVLEWVATNPVDAIKEYYREGSDLSHVKKFWTYIVLAQDWFNFETLGYTDCRIGFGPDAKCSGAQILAILAGCEDLGGACGLTTAKERPADPYVRSAREIGKLAGNNFGELYRADVKTPFMAIQYGGGVPSLRYKKFEPVLERIGVPLEKRNDFCSDVVIEGIMKSLGPKVNGIIDGLRMAASRVLEASGKDYFDYKHIDGFKCTKRGDAMVKLTEEYFTINFGQRGKGVIFGATEESNGGASGWIINSNVSGKLQRQNFVHYFPVHFVQGLDGVIARAIANACKAKGIKGYTSIHDQFRSCLRDATLMRECVNDAYRYVFIENNPLEALNAQLAKYEVTISGANPLEEIKNIVTEEILQSPNAFFFE